MEEVALSKEEPLSVDFRIFPERPARTNTPLPERLSVVSALVLVKLSLPPHEIIPKPIPIIKKKNKIFMHYFGKYNKKLRKNKK